MYNYFKFSNEMLLRYKEHSLRLIEMSEDSIGVFEIDSMTCVFRFSMFGGGWLCASDAGGKGIMTPSILCLYNDTMAYLVREY